MVDLDGPWGWRNLGLDKLDEIHKKLCSFEKMTVGQLVSGRGHHKIAASSVCKQARERLVELERDDLDDLWSLHLTTVERVWGSITGSTFSLLWWDPDHTVYPVGKSN